MTTTIVLAMQQVQVQQQHQLSAMAAQIEQLQQQPKSVAMAAQIEQLQQKQQQLEQWQHKEHLELRLLKHQVVYLEKKQRLQQKELEAMQEQQQAMHAGLEEIWAALRNALKQKLCRDAGRQGQKQRHEAAAAKAEEDAEEITAETGPLRATAAARREAAARVARSSSSSSRNVYDGRWSGDAEQEATEQPPELRDAEQEASKRVSE